MVDQQPSAVMGFTAARAPKPPYVGIGPVGGIECLSPELVAGHIASRATDVWALGVTLHRGLPGRGVYPDLPSSSLLDALRYLTDHRPVLDPHLAPDVAAVLGRCLNEDPGSRFLTAAELAETLSTIGEVVR